MGKTSIGDFDLVLYNRFCWVHRVYEFFETQLRPNNRTNKSTGAQNLSGE